MASPAIDAPVNAGPLPAARSTVAATWALFSGLALVMVGNGLNGTLLGVRAGLEGFGLAVTGVVMASYYAGFLLGSMYAVRALTTVGHIRVFAALASTASSAVLIHSVLVTPAAWVAMRFIFGLCMAGLYVVVESWLNDLSTNATRGRTLGLYMVVSLGGLSVGQLLFNVADAGGYGLFILASVLVSMSLVPVTLSATSSPPLHVPAAMSLRELVAVVPTGVIGSFWVGASHGTLLGTGAVYAAAAGLDTGEIALFMTAPLIGALACQYPVGLLADRFPRRAVMLVVSAAAAAAAVALYAAEPGSVASLGLMFVLGGVSMPLYSVVLAYANDWVAPDRAVAVSSALIRTNGAGSVLGPVVAAALMAVFEPSVFFLAVGGTHATIGLYVLYRILVAEGLPLERQRQLVVIPARASSLAASMLPRRRARPGGNGGPHPGGEPPATGPGWWPGGDGDDTDR